MSRDDRNVSAPSSAKTWCCPRRAPRTRGAAAEADASNGEGRHDAPLDAFEQVDEHDRAERDRVDHSVTARVFPEEEKRCRVHHPEGNAEEDRHEGGDGDAIQPRPESEDHREDGDRVERDRTACLGAGSDVRARASDEAGNGNAPEERTREVAEALADELLVGIASSALGGQLVCRGRRKERFERRQREDDEGQPKITLPGTPAGVAGKAGRGSARGMPDRFGIEPEHDDERGGECDRDEMCGQAAREARQAVDGAECDEENADRRRVYLPNELSDVQDDVEDMRLWRSRKAERARKLANQEDRPDTRREALDHRNGDEADEATQAEDPKYELEQPARNADEQQCRKAVLLHDARREPPSRRPDR